MMKFFTGFRKRMAVAGELYRMIKDRKQYILIPIFAGIVIILFLLFVGEMPAIMTLFYAMF